MAEVIEHRGKVQVQYEALANFCGLHNAIMQEMRYARTYCRPGTYQDSDFRPDMDASHIVKTYLEFLKPELPKQVKNPRYNIHYLNRFCTERESVFQYEFTSDIAFGKLDGLKEKVERSLDTYAQNLPLRFTNHAHIFEDQFAYEIDLLRFDHDEILDIFNSIKVELCS